MRLLQRHEDGTFGITEYTSGPIPPYATLSHTWWSDQNEVSFKDMVEGTAEEKAGFTKIRFCGELAAKDGLNHFWVDTCCIDKTSSAELSESINSMFRWYRNCVKCYVYLVDVSVVNAPSAEENSDEAWKSAFEKSRWFTRGWTLQELLAPTCVEFYSVEGEYLGDKSSLEELLHKITRIPVGALRGHVLSQFGVDERMAWSYRRNTRKEEDTAYCLFGIFDVHMPLIYGEGGKKAMRRLQKHIKEALEEPEERIDTLGTGQSLRPNEYIESQDKQYRLTLREDGDLVLTRSSDTVLWRSNSYRYSEVQNAVMRRDGNLVIYGQDGSILWATHTAGRPRASLILECDGNALVYSDDIAIWATHTAGGKTAECMEQGQRLLPQQSLLSQDSRYRLIMQDDGNLVLIGPTGPIWHSGTFGTPNVRDIVMQRDGNLVIYDENGHAFWASGTIGRPRSKLVVQDDGNVVIYFDDIARWATDTAFG